MSKPHESLTFRFEATYKRQVEDELEKLDKRSLETVMNLIDLELYLLGPQALARPELATESTGKALAMEHLYSRLRSVYDRRFVTPEKKKENPDE